MVGHVTNIKLVNLFLVCAFLDINISITKEREKRCCVCIQVCTGNAKIKWRGKAFFFFSNIFKTKKWCLSLNCSCQYEKLALCALSERVHVYDANRKLGTSNLCVCDGMKKKKSKSSFVFFPSLLSTKYVLLSYLTSREKR